ncbi:MAG: ribosome assembly factor SBDS [Candidatus Aminicenantia bacterium]
MSISIEKSVIARLTKSGERFEIMVDPKKALEVKSGKDVNLDELLATSEIYEDSKKGKRASEEKINKAFGTNDMKAIVYKIIRDGEVQLTTDQRREMIKEKTKKIADIISRRGINPQTNLPNPPERIMRAMEQAKIKIELNKRAEEQVDDIVKKIQRILPIKFEIVQLAIKVPSQFAGKASNMIRNFGKLKKEEWKSDGSYSCLIEIAAGLQQEVYDRLNSLTHGQVEVKKIKE